MEKTARCLCNAFYARSDVRLEGPCRVYVREGQEGRKIRQHFCPDCGTTIYSAGEKFPGMCMVPVGAFASAGPAERARAAGQPPGGASQAARNGRKAPRRQAHRVRQAR